MKIVFISPLVPRNLVAITPIAPHNQTFCHSIMPGPTGSARLIDCNASHVTSSTRHSTPVSHSRRLPPNRAPIIFTQNARFEVKSFCVFLSRNLMICIWSTGNAAVVFSATIPYSTCENLSTTATNKVLAYWKNADTRCTMGNRRSSRTLSRDGSRILKYQRMIYSPQLIQVCYFLLKSYLVSRFKLFHGPLSRMIPPLLLSRPSSQGGMSQMPYTLPPTLTLTGPGFPSFGPCLATVGPCFFSGKIWS